MREILFRGKRKDNGKWIEGYYFKHHVRQPCVIGDYDRPGDWDYLICFSGFADWNMPKPMCCAGVDPETVGQWTGLLDKNEHKIFEGDILRFGNSNVQVFWNEETFQWMASKLRNQFAGYRHYHDCCNGEWDDVDLGWIAAEVPIIGEMSTEIIGNIYDNPDLLSDEGDT